MRSLAALPGLPSNTSTIALPLSGAGDTHRAAIGVFGKAFSAGCAWRARFRWADTAMTGRARLQTRTPITCNFAAKRDFGEIDTRASCLSLERRVRARDSACSVSCSISSDGLEEALTRGLSSSNSARRRMAVIGVQIVTERPEHLALAIELVRGDVMALNAVEARCIVSGAADGRGDVGLTG